MSLTCGVACFSIPAVFVRRFRGKRAQKSGPTPPTTDKKKKPMRVLLRSVLFCALCLFVTSSAHAQKSSGPKTFHTEGVFSNITAGEGGDYGGMQIYLTDSH